MKIVMGAKNKLCFIDGTNTPSSLDSPLYEKGGLHDFILAIEPHLQ